MKRTLRILWYVLTLRCEEADRVRCAVDGEGLERYQVVGERLHRVLCSSCRAAKRQLDAVSRTLESLADETGAGVPMPADAKSRIARALDDES